MAYVNFKIKVKILDHWFVDNYRLGSSYICYALLEVNDELRLLNWEVE